MVGQSERFMIYTAICLLICNLTPSHSATFTTSSITCDGGDTGERCQNDIINCISTNTCAVRCNRNDDRRRLLDTFMQQYGTSRNLLWSCDSEAGGCCGVIVNCPVGHACNIDCNYRCHGLTVNAQQASSLSITNCDNCNEMSIHCPENGRGPIDGRCALEIEADISQLIVYAEESFYDFTVTNSNCGTCPHSITSSIIHCGDFGANIDHDCALTTDGTSCTDPSHTCVDYRIPTTNPTLDPTPSPTSDPTPAPTSNPTLSPTASTSAPTLSPTRVPTHNPTHVPTDVPSLVPSRFPSTTPTSEHVVIEETDTTSTPQDTTGAGIYLPDTQDTTGGTSGGNGGIIGLVVFVSIVAVIFFYAMIYWIMKKKRKMKEEYNSELIKAASSTEVYHTIPTDTIARAEKRVTRPKTMSVSGEHMEYNEVFGSPRVAVSALEENENENGTGYNYEYGNKNINENDAQLRLFYQAQFMEMMMVDPTQQAYLLKLNPMQRRQYIQYQTNLYLARVEDMARKKTLPMYDGDVDGDVDVATQYEESMGSVESADLEGDMFETEQLDEVSMEESDSIDNIHADEYGDDEESDESIIKTIETAHLVDIEPDSYFD